MAEGNEQTSDKFKQKGNRGKSAGQRKGKSGMSSHKSMENLASRALARREGTRHFRSEAPKLSSALSMENINANSANVNQDMLAFPYGFGNPSPMQYRTGQYLGYNPAFAETQDGLLPIPPTFQIPPPNIRHQDHCNFPPPTQYANMQATGYYSAAEFQRQQLHQPQHPPPLVDVVVRRPPKFVTPQEEARQMKADRRQDDRKQRHEKGKEKTKAKTNIAKGIKKDAKNDSSGSEEDDLDAEDVFRVLVKEFGGICNPKHLRRKFPQLPRAFDFSNWLEEHEHRFKILGKETSRGVMVVSFHFAATTCLDYCRMNRERKPCSNKRCPHYHVCRDYVIGNCYYDHCRYSHDFYDGHNRTLTEKNKLNALSNAEIRILASLRYPQVCKNYNLVDGCTDKFCNKLHLCKNFVLGRCLKGSDCEYEHRFKTDHNGPIIQAYGMNHVLEKSELTFRRLIYVWRDARPVVSAVEDKTNHSTTENKKEISEDGVNVKIKKDRTAPDHNKQTEEVMYANSSSGILTKSDHGSKDERKQSRKKGEQKKLPTTQGPGKIADLADKTVLCDAVLMNKCDRGNCRFELLHFLNLQLPYCWQINLYGSWITLDKRDNINVENAFCTLKDMSENFEICHDGVEYIAHIDFQTTPKGNVYETALGPESLIGDIFVRRLSTKSYVEAKGNSFITQWRWYWKPENHWCMFEPNTLQVTLERKYNAGQTKYLFCWSANSHRYRLDFKSMTAENVETNQLTDVKRRPLFVDNGDVMRQSVPSSLEIPTVCLPTKPPSWDPWDLGSPYEFVELEPESPEYEITAIAFYNSMDKERFPVDSIFRVQNPTLWRNFTTEEKNRAIKDTQDKKTSMTKRNLFHGTDSIDVVHGICRNGFDDRLAGKNATRYGEGAYFAVHAKYSHAYTEEDLTGKRYMFRAKVLVGEYCEGKREYKRPPSKPGNKHELYDSCVDNEANPTIFVVFECNHSYPEYLIQYKETNEEGKRSPYSNAVNKKKNSEAASQPECQSDVEALYKMLFKQEMKSAKSNVETMSQTVRGEDVSSREDAPRAVSPFLTLSRTGETSAHPEDNNATLTYINEFGF